MKVLRLLALVVALLAGGCGADANQPIASGLPSTTTLPTLPAAGLVVETAAGVDLLDLDGSVVASLAHWSLTRDNGTNQVVRDAEGIQLLSPTQEVTRLPIVWPTIERNDPPLDKTAPDGRVHGHWAGQFRSPDGRTLLGAWSGECESPSVWLADGDGPWRPIVAGDGGFPPESVTVGWAPDGRAVVYFTEGICGTGLGRPGTYLVTTTGTTTFVTEHPVDAVWRT